MMTGAKNNKFLDPNDINKKLKFSISIALETDEMTKRTPINILINVTSILDFYFKKLLINFFFLLNSSMISF
jgi:hypothetical protein